ISIPKGIRTSAEIGAIGSTGYLGGYAIKGFNTNDWTFFDKTTVKYGTVAAGLLLAGRYGPGVVKGVSSWKAWSAIGNGLGTFGKEFARFPVKHPYLTAGALTIGGYEAKLIAVGPSFDANGQWTWSSELSDLRTHLFLAPAYAFGGYKLLSNIPALGRGFSNMYKNVPAINAYVNGLAKGTTVFGLGSGATYLGISAYNGQWADLRDQNTRTAVLGGGALVLLGYRSTGIAKSIYNSPFWGKLGFSMPQWIKGISIPKGIRTSAEIGAIGSTGYLGGYAIKGFNTNDWTFFDKTTAKYGTTAAGLLLAGRYVPGLAKAGWNKLGLNNVSGKGLFEAAGAVLNPAAGKLSWASYPVMSGAIYPYFTKDGYTFANMAKGAGYGLGIRALIPANKIIFSREFYNTVTFNNRAIFLGTSTGLAAKDMQNPLVSAIGPWARLTGLYMDPGREVIIGIGEVLNWTGKLFNWTSFTNEWGEQIKAIRFLERYGLEQKDADGNVILRKPGFNMAVQDLANNLGVPELAFFVTLPVRTAGTVLELRSGSLFVSAFANPVQTMRDTLNIFNMVKDMKERIDGQKGDLPKASWAEYGDIAGNVLGMWYGAGAWQKSLISEGNLPVKLSTEYLAGLSGTVPVRIAKLADESEKLWLKLSTAERFEYFAAQSLGTAKGLQVFNTGLSLLLPAVKEGLNPDQRMEAIKQSAFALAYSPEEVNRSTIEAAVVWNALGAGYRGISESKLVQGIEGSQTFRTFMGDYAYAKLPFVKYAEKSHGTPMGRVITPVALIAGGSGMYYAGKNWFNEDAKGLTGIQEVIDKETGNKYEIGIEGTIKAPSTLGNYIADAGLIIAGIGGLVAMRNLRSPELAGSNFGKGVNALQKTLGLAEDSKGATKYYTLSGAAIGTGVGLWNESHKGNNEPIDWRNVIVFTGLGGLAGVGLKYSPKIAAFAGDLASIGSIAYGAKKAVFDPAVSAFEYWLSINYKDQNSARNYLDLREATEPHLFDAYTPWRYVIDKQGNKVDVNKDGIYDRAPFQNVEMKNGNLVATGLRPQTDLLYAGTLGLLVMGSGKFLKGWGEVSNGGYLRPARGVLPGSGTLTRFFKGEIARRVGSPELPQTILGRAYKYPGLTSAGVLATGAGTWALGRYVFNDTYLYKQVAEKDIEIDGVKYAKGQVISPGVNLGKIMEYTGYGFGVIGAAGLVTRGFAKEPTLLSQRIAGVGAATTKIFYVDTVGSSALNLVMVIAPLNGEISLASSYTKEFLSPSAYTGIERGFYNATFGAFWTTREEAYITMKQNGFDTLQEAINKGVINPQSLTFLAYEGLGSFSSEKSLYENAVTGLQYADRAFWLGLGGQKENGEAAIKGFGDYFARANGLTEKQWNDLSVQEAFNKAATNFWNGSSYAKTFFEEGLSSTNLNFAVILNLAGPLAREILPNIKTFNFGTNFQKTIYSLEKLGLPMSEAIHGSNDGVLKQGLRNFVVMSWNGSRQEMFDEQITQAALDLLPFISPEVSEYFQELANEGAHLEARSFSNARALSQVLANGATIVDVRLQAGSYADPEQIRTAAGLKGKGWAEIGNNPELLGALAEGLPAGTEIIVGFNQQAIAAGRIDMDAVYGVERAGNYEATYKITDSGWSEKDLGNQNVFNVWGKAAKLDQQLTAEGYTPAQQTRILSKLHFATPNPVTKAAAEKLLADNGLDTSDSTQMEMAARTMADHTGLHRLQVGKISVSTDALLSRRMYDSDFDQAVRTAQTRLGLYDTSSSSAASRALTSPMRSGSFSLHPLRGSDKVTWTATSQALSSALQASSVRLNDAYISYLRTGQNYYGLLAGLRNGAIQHVNRKIATEEAYDRVGKSGMSLLGKTVFHIAGVTVGLLGFGKKAELKRELKSILQNDYRVAMKLDKIDEQIKALTKRDAKMLAQLKIDASGADKKIKELKKEKITFEKIQKGKGKLRLGETYMEMYKQQLTMERFGRGINAIDAATFAQSRRTSANAGQIDTIIDSLKHKVARYDTGNIYYLLNPLLQSDIENFGQAGIAAANRFANVQDIDSEPLALRLHKNVEFESVEGGKLTNVVTGHTPSAQTVPPTAAGKAYKIKVDTTRIVDFKISTDGQGNKMIAPRLTSTGIHDIGAMGHEQKHIIGALAKSLGHDFEGGSSDMDRFVQAIRDEEGLPSANDVNVKIEEMKGSEKMAIAGGFYDLPADFTEDDPMTEVDDDIMKLGIDLEFITNPRERMNFDIFEQLSNYTPEKLVTLSHNWVTKSKSGVRTDGQNEELVRMEEIFNEAVSSLQAQTSGAALPGLRAAEARKIFVDKVRETAALKGIPMPLIQRLTSVSVGRDTALEGYQPKNSATALMNHDELRVNAAFRAKDGELYEWAHSWTVGEASPLQNKAHSVLSATLRGVLPSLLASGKIHNWEELDHEFVREHLKQEGFEYSGYWQKRQRAADDEDKRYHSSPLFTYADGRPAEGLIRQDDVVRVQLKGTFPNLAGFNEGMTFVVGERQQAEESDIPSLDSASSAAKPFSELQAGTAVATRVAEKVNMKARAIERQKLNIALKDKLPLTIGDDGRFLPTEAKAIIKETPGIIYRAVVNERGIITILPPEEIDGKIGQLSDGSPIEMVAPLKVKSDETVKGEARATDKTGRIYTFDVAADSKGNVRHEPVFKNRLSPSGTAVGKEGKHDIILESDLLTKVKIIEEGGEIVDYEFEGPESGARAKADGNEYIVKVDNKTGEEIPELIKGKENNKQGTAATGKFNGRNIRVRFIEDVEVKIDKAAGTFEQSPAEVLVSGKINSDGFDRIFKATRTHDGWELKLEGIELKKGTIGSLEKDGQDHRIKDNSLPLMVEKDLTLKVGETTTGIYTEDNGHKRAYIAAVDPADARLMFALFEDNGKPLIFKKGDLVETLSDDTELHALDAYTQEAKAGVGSLNPAMPRLINRKTGDVYLEILAPNALLRGIRQSQASDEIIGKVYTKGQPVGMIDGKEATLNQEEVFIPAQGGKLSPVSDVEVLIDGQAIKVTLPINETQDSLLGYVRQEIKNLSGELVTGRILGILESQGIKADARLLDQLSNLVVDRWDELESNQNIINAQGHRADQLREARRQLTSSSSPLILNPALNFKGLSAKVVSPTLKAGQSFDLKEVAQDKPLKNDDNKGALPVAEPRTLPVAPIMPNMPQGLPLRNNTTPLGLLTSLRGMLNSPIEQVAAVDARGLTSPVKAVAASSAATDNLLVSSTSVGKFASGVRVASAATLSSGRAGRVGRRQITDDRGQMSDGRGQMTDVRLQTTEDRSQIDVGRRNTENEPRTTNGSGSNVNSGSGAGKAGLGGLRVRLPERLNRLNPNRVIVSSPISAKARFFESGIAPPVSAIPSTTLRANSYQLLALAKRNGQTTALRPAAISQIRVSSPSVTPTPSLPNNRKSVLVPFKLSRNLFLALALGIGIATMAPAATPEEPAKPQVPITAAVESEPITPASTKDTADAVVGDVAKALADIGVTTAGINKLNESERIRVVRALIDEVKRSKNPRYREKLIHVLEWVNVPLIEKLPTLIDALSDSSRDVYEAMLREKVGRLEPIFSNPKNYKAIYDELARRANSTDTEGKRLVVLSPDKVSLEYLKNLLGHIHETGITFLPADGKEFARVNQVSGEFILTTKGGEFVLVLYDGTNVRTVVGDKEIEEVLRSKGVIGGKGLTVFLSGLPSVAPWMPMSVVRLLTYLDMGHTHEPEDYKPSSTDLERYGPAYKNKNTVINPFNEESSSSSLEESNGTTVMMPTFTFPELAEQASSAIRVEEASSPNSNIFTGALAEAKKVITIKQNWAIGGKETETKADKLALAAARMAIRLTGLAMALPLGKIMKIEEFTKVRRLMSEAPSCCLLGSLIYLEVSPRLNTASYYRTLASEAGHRIHNGYGVSGHKGVNEAYDLLSLSILRESLGDAAWRNDLIENAYVGQRLLEYIALYPEDEPFLWALDIASDDSSIPVPEKFLAFLAQGLPNYEDFILRYSYDAYYEWGHCVGYYILQELLKFSDNDLGQTAQLMGAALESKETVDFNNPKQFIQDVQRLKLNRKNTLQGQEFIRAAQIIQDAIQRDILRGIDKGILPTNSTDSQFNNLVRGWKAAQNVIERIRTRMGFAPIKILLPITNLQPNIKPIDYKKIFVTEEKTFHINKGAAEPILMEKKFSSTADGFASLTRQKAIESLQSSFEITNSTSEVPASLDASQGGENGLPSVASAKEGSSPLSNLDDNFKGLPVAVASPARILSREPLKVFNINRFDNPFSFVAEGARRSIWTEDRGQRSEVRGNLSSVTLWWTRKGLSLLQQGIPATRFTIFSLPDTASLNSSAIISAVSGVKRHNGSERTPSAVTASFQPMKSRGLSSVEQLSASSYQLSAKEERARGEKAHQLMSSSAVSEERAPSYAPAELRRGRRGGAYTGSRYQVTGNRLGEELRASSAVSRRKFLGAAAATAMGISAVGMAGYLFSRRLNEGQPSLKIRGVRVDMRLTHPSALIDQGIYSENDLDMELEVAQLKYLGVNTIMSYEAFDLSDRRVLALLRMLKANDIRLIIGIPYNKFAYFSGYYKVAPGPNMEDGSYKDYIREYIRRSKEDPDGFPDVTAVSFGNEYNFMFKSHPDWIGVNPAIPDAGNIAVDKWYSQLQEAARASREIIRQAYELDAQKSIKEFRWLISTDNGQFPGVWSPKYNLQEALSRLKQCPNIDIWGLIIYNWDAPAAAESNVFEHWRSLIELLRKEEPARVLPLMFFSEAGADSFYTTEFRKFGKGGAYVDGGYIDEEGQEKACAKIWGQIEEYADVCLGCAFMMFKDYPEPTARVFPGMPYDGFINYRYLGWFPETAIAEKSVARWAHRLWAKGQENESFLEWVSGQPNERALLGRLTRGNNRFAARFSPSAISNDSLAIMGAPSYAGASSFAKASEDKSEG
ncbi:MAG: hypothetical protein PHQ96_06270, partial [Candidatus Omnitrophica bacterium]|nr:hypothetical protein [Candidatus Omnitrophota bacterium]